MPTLSAKIWSQQVKVLTVWIILILTTVTIFFTPVVRVFGIKDDFCVMSICIRGSLQDITWMLRTDYVFNRLKMDVILIL